MVSQLNQPLEGHAKAFLPDEYFEFKSKIHDRLLDQLDLSVLDRIDPSILKSELVHTRRFEGPRDTLSAIFEYIEVFYNNQRRHSTLGYLSPAKFEQQIKTAVCS